MAGILLARQRLRFEALVFTATVAEPSTDRSRCLAYRSRYRSRIDRH
jgi:hypothetical protein